MKSWSRVPTASTTSASAASALAEVAPITPIGPTFIGWSWTRTVRPAMVSTTGTLWLLGEGGERSPAQRIVDAAAGDDQRLLRLAEQLRRFAELVGVGPRPRDAVDGLLEELDRIVEGLGLDVLGKADEGRAAVAGSSMIATACGSDEMICSGRVIRSQ